MNTLIFLSGSDCTTINPARAGFRLSPPERAAFGTGGRYNLFASGPQITSLAKSLPDGSGGDFYFNPG